MKTKFFLFLTLLLLPNLTRSENITSSQPNETLILYIPNNDKEWKEISRYVTSEEGCVERIPCNQTRKNWSELIAIQFFKKDSFTKKIVSSIDNALDALSNQILKSYDKVSWKLLEKNEKDALFEWKLTKTARIPTQHIISRIFITKNGLHQIAITIKYRHMTPEERKKWIGIFREYVELIPMNQVPLCDQYYSLDNTLEDALEVEKISPWKLEDQYSTEMGFKTSVYYSPNSRQDVSETLTVSSIPTINDTTIDFVFENEKAAIRKKINEKVEIKILAKKENEIIYSYNFPYENGLQFSVITRSFLTEKGYFSLVLGIIQEKGIDETEQLTWKAKLEKVQLSTKTCMDI